MKQEQAETIAIQALGWLAQQSELLEGFISNSGADVNDLKQMATNPTFLGAVLDFLLMDDTQVIAFCDSIQLPYTDINVARQSLPGGEMMNWT